MLRIVDRLINSVFRELGALGKTKDEAESRRQQFADVVRNVCKIPALRVVEEGVFNNVVACKLVSISDSLSIRTVFHLLHVCAYDYIFFPFVNDSFSSSSFLCIFACFMNAPLSFKQIRPSTRKAK